ncbi:MAG: 4-hydroxythreonine-4-phosphate dehydrogenase PdxA [Gemmatimonadaceae bacterium]|nr:4-hydroxythreonine-4-phosphate dehydrogenase PdxA [Gemmatimonadaceae bacterium]
MRIAISAGDPRGIGPEIITKALADSRISGRCDFVVIGPAGAGVEVQESIGEWKNSGAADAGRLAGLAIERAVQMAMNGDVAGIVTAPIDKAALAAGGFDYPGHTEMLGALTGTDVAMMLASEKLRVVLATTHLALKDVVGHVTHQAIVSAASVTRTGLREWFGIADPRIALCALNPHAGDGGRFGLEDQTVLTPAAKAARIAGPFPADTVFVRAMRGEFDAVIAPYHDVGMTAIKVASFGSAVNVTLGLPFPRTSPDHGTALDIAGQGRADPSSFIEAILLCCRIAGRAR